MNWPSPIRALLSVLIVALAVLPWWSSYCHAQMIWHAQATPMWHVLTTHWVHLDGLHLLFNACAYLLIAALAEKLQLFWPAHAAALLAWLIISLVLVAGFWPVQWYVGLSGILHAELAAAMTIVLINPGHRRVGKQLRLLAALGVIIMLAKIFSETDRLVIIKANWPVLTLAHQLGFACGTMFAFVYCYWPVHAQQPPGVDIQ